VPPRDERAVPGRNRSSGFTLIELTAVLAIAALLLFFALPNVDGLSPKYRLRSAARRIASTIEAAQSQAIAEGKDMAIAYDLDHGSYWVILGAPDPVVASPGTTARPGTSTTATTTLSSSATASAPPLPQDDAEHGVFPVLPSTPGSTSTSTTTPGSTASSTSTSKPGSTPSLISQAPRSYDGRETLSPETLGDDLQIASVTLATGQEATSGTIIVPLSQFGDEGSHAVLVRLKNANGTATDDAPLSVRFNALTRTIDFGDQKLGFTQLGAQ